MRPHKDQDLFGNNAICYQGIQRTFRNSVVAFLRTRLQALYPQDHLQRLKQPFGDNWSKVVQNATDSRELGGTTTTIRDDYDLLDVSHFFAVFEKYYDKLFSASAGHPEGQRKPNKHKLLGNLKGIKDSRDPLSHPVEEEVDYDEAFAVLSDAKQVLDSLGFSEQSAQISNLTNKLRGAASESPSVVRYLPTEDSIYSDFVGRSNLLEQLTDYFRDPEHRRCLLAGDGGKGKSAVAYRFAQQCAKSDQSYHLIVWLSAKRRRFREGKGVSVESPDFTCLDDAVNELLFAYGALEQDLSEDIAERRRLLLEFLRSFPAFIVADDIDTLLEDDAVVSLFTHEIPHTRSAVLLTSRRNIPGIHSFVVKGFEGEEAEAFVRSRVQLFDLDHTLFTPRVISGIVSVTEGSPLYIEDLLRLARVLDVHKAIKAWADGQGDEARRYALQRELEMLSPDARRVLVAASVSDDPVSFAELETILSFSEERLVPVVAELQKLFLIPKPKAVEGEQRFELNLNTKKLVRMVEGSTDLYARIDRHSQALRGKLGAVGSKLIAALIRQAHLRLNAGRHDDAEALLLEAIDKYPQAPDLLGFLGYLYKRVGRVAEARDKFEAAVKLGGRRKDMFLQWVTMEIGGNEWSRAINAANKGLKVIPQCLELMDRKVYAKRQAGFDFHRGFHREKAEKMWREAVEDARGYAKSPEQLETGERPLNSSMLGSAVICLDMLRDFDERDRWFDRWASEHPDDPTVHRQREFQRRKYGT